MIFFYDSGSEEFRFEIFPVKHEVYKPDNTLNIISNTNLWTYVLDFSYHFSEDIRGYYKGNMVFKQWIYSSKIWKHNFCL
jgi:hypothetical protein